ncbi:MAG: bile acid:sodium symporter [Ferruginibacter sp.]|nr:bile acid:sodium symporter [Cytophagales bacterium]
MNVPQAGRQLARVGLDGFLLALAGVIGLAYGWPSAGIRQGPLSLEAVAGHGVSLVFFFYGLRLSPAKLREGLHNWRLHAVVQAATFVAFPLVVLTGRMLFAGEEPGWWWLGVFYLAVLPSTVSSSVVRVSIAGGNLPAAFFNAGVSSLLGVLITPLWMSWLIPTDLGGFDAWGVVGQLTRQVVAPVAVGILLHPRLGALAEHHRRRIRFFDQSVILLIVYTSFCQSFARDVFRGFRVSDLLLLGTSLLGLFFLMFGLIHLVSRRLGFNREDRITALFCGSKKSLVHGTVMAKVLFAGTAATGLVLLPLMVYHALQLVAASAVAGVMARRAGVAT